LGFQYIGCGVGNQNKAGKIPTPPKAFIETKQSMLKYIVTPPRRQLPGVLFANFVPKFNYLANNSSVVVDKIMIKHNKRYSENAA
jgi:hypothetical protein